MNFNTKLPQNDWFVDVPHVHFGVGRIIELSDIINQSGYKVPLLVTDKGLTKLPVITDTLEQLRRNGLNAILFNEVKSNPTMTNVKNGLNSYQENNCDIIIAIGGGSSVDVAKAISLIANNNHTLWDFCYFEDPENCPEIVADNFFVPYVVVPTTAGTGSELSGCSCVIVDEVTGAKRVPYHPEHNALAVIDDPALLEGLPANLTAWTGVDALTHGIEAYCAPNYHPMCDGIAIESIRLCHLWLKQSVNNGKDLEARSHMMAASSIAAVAFTGKGLGAVHSLAHALGSIYDTHHGLANAVLLPYVLKHNAPAIEEKIAYVARCLNLKEASFSAFIDWLLQLRSDLNIPHTLRELDLPIEAKVKVAEYAMRDAEHHNNPLVMQQKDFEKIFLNAYNGEI